VSGSLIVRDATYLVIGLISCAYASFDFADTISLPITTFGELVAFCTDSAGRQHSSRHERGRLRRNAPHTTRRCGRRSWKRPNS